MADRADRAAPPSPTAPRRPGAGPLAPYARASRPGAVRLRRPTPDAAAVLPPGRDPAGSDVAFPGVGMSIRGARPSASPVSLLLAQKRVDDRRRAIPLSFLGGELAASGGGDRVVPRFPVVVGDAPLRAQEPALLQAHQPRVERAHIQAEGAGGDLFQPRGDRVAMQRSERRHGLQHHEVERALQDVSLFGLSIRHANRAYTILLGRQVEWHPNSFALVLRRVTPTCAIRLTLARADYESKPANTPNAASRSARPTMFVTASVERE